MDGLPVFSLLEFALPDCRLLGFEAVFNATTNFIIDAMGDGRGLRRGPRPGPGRGLRRGRPEHDIDGWDAACKTAALANVAMDAGITPADIEQREPARRARRAHPAGARRRQAPAPGHRVWREPARRRRRRRPVRGRLRAEELDIDHPLAPLGGESLGVVLHTDLMADVVVAEIGALVPQTAYGVYADLLHLCRTR